MSFGTPKRRGDNVGCWGASPRGGSKSLDVFAGLPALAEDNKFGLDLRFGAAMPVSFGLVVGDIL